MLKQFNVVCVDGLLERLWCQSPNHLLKHGSEVVFVLAEFSADLPFVPLVVSTHLGKLPSAFRLGDLVSIGVGKNDLPLDNDGVIKGDDLLSLANTDAGLSLKLSDLLNR